MRYEKTDVDLKITVTVSGKHEGNDSPWWLIINPRQNFQTCQDRGVHNIANMITGPFFSRESAQEHLDSRRYAFGKNACVFAHSGYYAHEYKEAIRAAKRLLSNGGRDMKLTAKEPFMSLVGRLRMAVYFCPPDMERRGTTEWYYSLYRDRELLDSGRCPSYQEAEQAARLWLEAREDVKKMGGV